jgi:hypothetical protein
MLRTRIARAAVAIMLGTALVYSTLQGIEWAKRPPPTGEFEGFVAEARAAIPPHARVLVRWPGGGEGITWAHLHTRLHPRRVVLDGPAEWIIEIPAGPFDRSRAVLRAARP